ncbi:MAG: ornithine cyclodeaminase family protein [Acidobacteria bacterium]|nr:ornithine cyclodeaminase family protein [Acidobacteriota bacterium]MBV9068537.1 ornithine cyclodeaminase family protein [Acidobacteriota bacterium]MBV9186685.1 ornithine cyclodeaminase family protein [Acidobacteriota bacterium]
MTRILTAADVAALLTIDDCIAAVETAFRDFGEGRIAPPQTLGVHAKHGTFHVKAAAADIFAAKINANFPDNPRQHGLPTIQGLIVVMDVERGTPLGILDSTLITTLRTAAATAVAAKHLARNDSRTMTIIGCGIQGRAHTEALLRVRTIAKVFAYDADPAAAARFTNEMSQRLGIEVVISDSIEIAVAQSDIVITCTPARSPILGIEHRHDGLFIGAVGADNPEKNELAPALLAQSRVVPDILDQAAVMGDLHHAIAAGVMTRDDIHGELADIVCDRVPGRRDNDEVFIFDSTGTALQDVATASIALTRAVERGAGVEIKFTQSHSA